MSAPNSALGGTPATDLSCHQAPSTVHRPTPPIVHSLTLVMPRQGRFWPVSLPCCLVFLGGGDQKYQKLISKILQKKEKYPKINSLHRFDHDRFSKAKNKTSKCPLSRSLSLRILGRIRSSEIETLLFLHPIANWEVARLWSQQ